MGVGRVASSAHNSIYRFGDLRSSDLPLVNV